MKNSLGQKLPQKLATFATVALATAFSAISLGNQTSAATFEQKQVEQGNFIAVAQPFGANSHQLLIIEQKSNKRACWSESGTNPVIVDPLLLNFDFTGICGRSTDSNGYSMRMAGEDLGLDYILSIVERNGELLLVGKHRLDRKAPEVIIGRTGGISQGFMKIFLQPGWEFAKRMFNGKELGHVYLATNTPLGNTGSTDPSDLPPLPPRETSKFRDIANDVYASEIEKAVAMGFIAGFQDNTFRPQGFLTREQLVSMVIEGLGKLPGATITVPTQASGRPYRDVEAGRWSAAKIQWARDNNIVSGYPDGTFRPNKSVTRAELMAVQKKAAEFAKSLQGQPGVLVSNGSVTQFSDTEGHWAVALISEMSAYCQVASPLNERGNAFLPDSQARRNYAAAATLRMLNCVQQPITQNQ
ncbi:DUF3747 domain-containing protein [Moorena producens JHB]|uniref:DUF3747 domain-containing protein n=1 Tax=Moorena producens (strain JHB) TaxID=1454205 RepID=A0A1D9G1W0_MOOP1|nr:DUF3747 domain-containing protein [Moorena producens]AOY81603.1 DUF3747 domain-containing protein [Moorena producens JHB]